MASRYILFNKPYGVVTQFSDRAGQGHRTLKEYVPVPGVYPVGRLDKDSEGLLLLTDDGAMQHRLSHPKFEHEKTYWVQVEGSPSEAELEPLRKGILIQDYRTLPARAALIAPPDVPPRDPPVRYRAAIPDTWLEITLREGRNRQVRRMTAAAGFPTLRLIRISVGPLKLAGMKPGEWRDCTQEERNQLTRSARSKE